MRHIIAMLMENESGALSRVAGLFSARGYNIESLNVAPTEDPSLSRMTLVTRGTDEVIEQITKQLNKLVDVVKLTDLTEGPHVERELMLLKAKVNDVIKSLASDYNAQILDVTDGACIIELTGTGDTLDKFIQSVDSSNILEVVRSGVSGITCGAKGLKI
jgi:acetolactate synthase-1/3 small subunit